MSTRRNFLKLGALFVPAAIVGPRVGYSFLWAKPEAATFIVYRAWTYDIVHEGVVGSDGRIQFEMPLELGTYRVRVTHPVERALSLGGT